MKCFLGNTENYGKQVKVAETSSSFLIRVILVECDLSVRQTEWIEKYKLAVYRLGQFAFTSLSILLFEPKRALPQLFFVLYDYMRLIVRILKHFDDQILAGCFVQVNGKEKSCTYSFNTPANVQKDWSFFRHFTSDQGFRIFFTRFSLQHIAGLFPIVSHINGRNSLNRVGLFGCNELLHYFPTLRYCFGIKYFKMSAASFEDNPHDFIGLDNAHQLSHFLEKHSSSSATKDSGSFIRNMFPNQQLNAARDFITISPELPFYEDDSVRIYAIDISKPSDININGKGTKRYCYHITERDQEKQAIDKEKFEQHVPRQFRRMLIAKGSLMIDGKELHLKDFASIEGTAHILILDIQNSEDLSRLISSTYPTSDLFQKLGLIVHLAEKSVLESPQYTQFIKNTSAQFGCKHLITAGGYFSRKELQESIGTPSFAFLNFNNILTQCFPGIIPAMPVAFFTAWSAQRRDQRNVSAIETAPYYGDGSKIWLSRLVEQIHVKNSEVISIPQQGSTLMLYNSTKATVFKSHQQLCMKIKQFAEQQAAAAGLVKHESETQLFPVIIPLGTSSSLATSLRNESSYLINTSDNTSVLLDCGPSTFYQLLKQFVREDNSTDNLFKEISKIKVLVISHHHTDHHFGIVDFLAERKRILAGSNVGKILLIVPSSIRSYLVALDVIEGCSLEAEIITHEDFTGRRPDEKKLPIKMVSQSVTSQLKRRLQEEEKQKRSVISQEHTNVSDDGDDMMLDFSLDSISSQSSPTEMRSNLESSKVKEILSEAQLSQLNLFPILHCEGSMSVMLTLVNGQKILYSGDGRPAAANPELNNVNFLIHECTFTKAFSSSAYAKNHSFLEEVLSFAQNIRANHLILSHYSVNGTVQQLAKRVDPSTYHFEVPNDKRAEKYANTNTIFAFDNMVIRPELITDMPIVSRIILKVTSL